MSWEERIIVDPAVLAGKPVIKGTRMAVEFIINLLAEGWSYDEVIKNYPRITHQDILAALQYAGEALRSEKVYPMPTRRA